MADQTFHTPSFGDEDFDIPAIHPHQQQHHQQQQQQQQQHDLVHGYQTQMMQGGGMQQSPDSLSLDPGGYQQPLYLQQEHTMQPINVSSAYTSPQASCSSMSSPGQQQQHSGQQLLLLQQQHNQQQQQQHSQQAQVQMHMQYMHNQAQQQMHTQAQQQMQYGSSTGGSPPAVQPNIIPENNNTTTSEDSDDSTPHSAMITGIKRPSPEPADVVNKTQKKPKAQKKKKKRDPNEPSKPVSAYALFFRDTQAAIKGPHPNATFGEVSKIVASMWDALDTEHKNVYKKKTEAAKKEYLKALAAYRASIVSKSGEGEQPQPQVPPPQQQPPPQVQYGGYGGYPGNQRPGNVAYQVYSPQPQPPSPQQQHQQHQQHQQQMPIKKSPLHLGGMQQTHQQQPQGMIGNAMAQPHMTQQQHMQQQVSQQQYMQQVPQQQVQQQIMHISPSPADSLSSPPPVTGQQTGHVHRPPSNSCIRHGCPNPAVANNEWEDEYCSNECVVSHCRDVFTTWVSSNQNSQQNFSTVK